MNFRNPSERSTGHHANHRIEKVLTAITLLSFLFITAICMSDGSDAQTIDYNIGAVTETDVIAVYDTETHAVMVSGTGAMKDFSSIDEVPWHPYKTQILTLTVGNDVTSIGRYAFCECTSMGSAAIGSSVVSIGGSAFDGCTSLSTVTVSNKAVPSLRSDSFSNCTSLSEILVPSGSVGSYKTADVWKSYAEVIFTDISTCTVEDIKDVPWIGYQIEPEVTVKDGDISLIKDKDYTVSYGKNTDIGVGTVMITGIGDYRGSYIKTFYIVEKWAASATGSDNVALLYNHNTRTFTVSGTGAMKDYSYDGQAPWLGTFKNEIDAIIIEDGVTNVGAYAFSSCTNVISLTAGKDLVTIGSNAFRNCTSLSSVKLSDGVTTLCDNAFAECTSLTSFTLPDSVSVIESSVFEKSGLVSVNIPAKTRLVGPSAFATDTLTQITVSDDNTKYCTEDGVLFNKHKTSIVCYPAGMTAKSYSIPDTVTSLQMAAFRYCSHLESVTIPNDVEALPLCVFYQCTSLKSVTVPCNVEYFDDYAFANCTSLESVTVVSKTAPPLKDNSFSNCTSLSEILVPYGSVDSYRTADVWSMYSDRIFAGITLCTVGDIGNQCYTGSQIKPTATVKDGDKTLTDGTDYTLSYGENIGIGEGTVTIMGAGIYRGIIIKTFVIGEHDHVVVPGRVPAKTQTGLTEGEKCSVCGYIFTEQKVIPATGTEKSVIESNGTGVKYYVPMSDDIKALTVELYDCRYTIELREGSTAKVRGTVIEFSVTPIEHTDGRYTVIMKSNGSEFTEQANITLPYDPSKGTPSVKWVEGNENMDIISFDETNKTVIFSTAHNSTYEVEYQESDNTANGITISVVLIAAVAIIGLMVCFIYAGKK